MHTTLDRVLCWQSAPPTLLYTLAYAACGYASLRLFDGNGVVDIAFWPSSGVALAAFMRLGLRAWPVALLGEVLTALPLPGIPLSLALMTGIVRAAETLPAYWILQRYGVQPQLRSVNHVLCLVAAAAIGASLGGCIATIGQALNGTIQWNRFFQESYRWWLGDWLGMMIVAPFIAAWTTQRTGHNESRRSRYFYPNLAALFAGCLLTTVAVFMPQMLGITLTHDNARLAFPLLIFPFMMAAALYFRFRDITLLLLLVAGIALSGTAQGHSAFSNAANPFGTVALYLFVTSLICLVLYARSCELSGALSTLRNDEKRRLAREITLRETLVREIHHRIKNNLQGVTGVLRRQAERDPQLSEPIKLAISQVQSIASIHGIKGHSPTASIRLGELIRSVAAEIDVLWQRLVAVDIPPVLAACFVAETEAVPLGLVLNELILNAVKHGKGFDYTKITVRDGENPGTVRITIQNTGELPPDFNFQDQGGDHSGLQLVASLLPHVGARLSWEQSGNIVSTVLELEPPVIAPITI